jgi:hypothetical protein
MHKYTVEFTVDYLERVSVQVDAFTQRQSITIAKRMLDGKYTLCEVNDVWISGYNYSSKVVEV